MRQVSYGNYHCYCRNSHCYFDNYDYDSLHPTAKAELDIDQMIKKGHDMANAISGLPENCEKNQTGSGSSTSFSMNVQCK